MRVALRQASRSIRTARWTTSPRWPRTTIPSASTTAHLSPSVSMVEAVEAARDELRRAGLRGLCADGAVRVLRSPSLVAENP